MYLRNACVGFSCSTCDMAVYTPRRAARGAGALPTDTFGPSGSKDFSPSSSEDLGAGVAQVTPCPSCARGQPWFPRSLLTGVPYQRQEGRRGRPPRWFRGCFGSDRFSCGSLCPESIQGLLENRRQMCNLRITDMLLLPQLAKRQHFRSGNVPGCVLTLGKKREKSKREKEKCVLSQIPLNKYFSFKLFERRLIAKNRNPVEEGTIKGTGTAESFRVFQGHWDSDDQAMILA